MNKLTNTLLAGAALCALGAVPAIAGNHPALSFTALHAGRVVNKTKLHVPGAQHVTYTFSAYTTIQAELGQKVKLDGLFYKFNSNSTICSSPKQKIKVDPKKTTYGKAGTATETYSLGCASGPTVFYGDTYKLTNPDGFGQTDHFVSILTGTFKNSSGKYKGTLNLDVSVTIEK